MQVVITGVAGYIGAHVANYFLESGYEVIGIDNLSTGYERFIDNRIQFIKGDAQNSQIIDQAFVLLKDKSESAIIHCAGLKYAGESVKKPLDFYENNSQTTLQILKSMEKFGLKNLVFSSSCSVYGEISSNLAVTEDAATIPLSPYGRSKRFAEEMIEDFVKTGKIKAISLRYFNVAGNGKIAAYDASPYNLFPNLYRAIQNENEFKVFGNDYSTYDGTAIRDYVDVRTLSQAHYDVFKLLSSGIENGFEIYNLGSGVGFSVQQIISRTKELIASNLRVAYLPRRAGDPSKILADVSKAKKVLNWKHNASIDEIIKSGWDAWQGEIN